MKPTTHVVEATNYEDFVDELNLEHLKLIEEVNNAEFNLEYAKKELRDFEQEYRGLLGEI